MSLALLIAVVGLVAVLLPQAVARCRREIAGQRTADRRRAEIADVFGRARHRWDVGTAVLAEAAERVERLNPGMGFGDMEVAQAVLARAWREVDLVEENR